MQINVYDSATLREALIRIVKYLTSFLIVNHQLAINLLQSGR
jgi:hypothetical protein